MSDLETSTVLVIDDEPVNLAVITSVLQPHYRVRATTSGELGLQAAGSDPRPDLILLDVMMPNLDGYGVLRKLRANPATSDIPVIFVTALADETNEEYGLTLGAVDYITKPIKSAIVLARVAAQLELKRARGRLADHNAWLEAEVARRMDEISAIQEVGLHALAELAETRDTETGNHIRRTQKYVATLALHLSIHPQFRDALQGNAIALLTASAPLHDIGKVGIPDTILLKQGKFTPDEMAIMQTHAKLGAEAIERALQQSHRPVDFLNTAREIALWHHERWDGSGYPDGLAGEAIPVSARIMAVADVFDALVTRRVYKQAISFDQARDIILEGRGRHFDPDMVDTFINVYDEFVDIATRFADTSMEHKDCMMTKPEQAPKSRPSTRA